MTHYAIINGVFFLLTAVVGNGKDVGCLILILWYKANVQVPEQVKGSLNAAVYGPSIYVLQQ